MPLWEGFDEPFHYGFVQTLGSRHSLPVLGSTPLSDEVFASLRLAPASFVVKQNLPFAVTFSEYFAMPEADRRNLHDRLWSLPSESRSKETTGANNYEVQQAPLAYVAMVPADLLWRDVALPRRVWRLRIFTAVIATILEALLGILLARAVGLDPAWQASVLLLVFSSQMFYASVARVSNDWLAVPALTLVFLAALRFRRVPSYARAALLGGAVAAGLLTKAYFLFALPFAVLAVIAAGRRAVRPALLACGIVLATAGPWYARNIALYGNLTGAQQAAQGIGTRETLWAALKVPWLKAIAVLFRSALWTGNNSFTSFSARTTYAVMILLACAFLLWLRAPRERLLAAGCGIFFLTMLYGEAMFYAQSGVIVLTPWYTIAAAAPFACLICLGLSRSGKLGTWIAVVLHVLFAYMISATFLLKLIPLYSGYPEDRIKLAPLLAWYRSGAGRDLLGATALVPAAVIWSLAAGATAAAVTLCVMRCRRLILSAKTESPPGQTS
jgi:hypothetical protein